MSPNAENTSNVEAAASKDVEEGLTPNEDARLSALSKKYDRNNKGYLDENEKKMREMDTSNRGFLTNDKVYSMLEEQVKLQKTLVTHRRLIIGLCVFAVVLALANMGTAFAAANLSKDTTTDSANNLVNKHTNEIMGTKAKGSIYEVITGTGEDGRRLAPTSMSKEDAESLYADFIDGTPYVNVRFTCAKGEVIQRLSSPVRRISSYEYSYAGVRILCNAKASNEPCRVVGLSCSSYGGDATGNESDQVEHHVYSSCPPPSSPPQNNDSCDPDEGDDLRCVYTVGTCTCPTGGEGDLERVFKCDLATKTFSVAERCEECDE